MSSAFQGLAARAEPLAFTVDEFAEAFRLSRATVYNMWRDGRGPAKMRVRGRVLISREAADRWRRAPTVGRTDSNARTQSPLGGAFCWGRVKRLRPLDRFCGSF